MKKDRRKFIKDGLASAAAVLSGSVVYGMYEGEEGEEMCDPDPPTYSVSVSPDRYRLESCGRNYDFAPEDSQMPAGMPEELYKNSSEY